MDMEAAEVVGKSWRSHEGCCQRTVWGEARGRQLWGRREPPDLMGSPHPGRDQAFSLSIKTFQTVCKQGPLDSRQEIISRSGSDRVFSKH